MRQAGLLSIQTPFLRCKMLVGLCPIPFILHHSDAGCAFFSKRFYLYKVELQEICTLQF